MYEIEPVVTLKDSNFTLINTLRNGDTTIDIYKYSPSINCNKYIKVVNGIKMLGYFLINKFHFVSLVDNVPPTMHTDIIKIINTIKTNYKYTSGENNTMLSQIQMELQKNPDLHIITRIDDENQNPCHQKKILSKARNTLVEINDLIGSDIGYTVDLDYVYSKPKNYEINALELNGDELILCINKDSVCVASILMYLREGTHEVVISSKTKQQFERLGMNKILRCLVIILSKSIFPTAQFVLSESVNPVSAWIMINRLNGYPNVHQNFKSYKDLYEFIRSGEDLEVRVDINIPNIKNARKVFNKTVADTRTKLNPPKPKSASPSPNPSPNPSPSTSQKPSTKPKRVSHKQYTKPKAPVTTGPANKPKSASSAQKPKAGPAIKPKAPKPKAGPAIITKKISFKPSKSQSKKGGGRKKTIKKKKC